MPMCRSRPEYRPYRRSPVLVLNDKWRKWMQCFFSAVSFELDAEGFREQFGLVEYHTAVVWVHVQRAHNAHWWCNRIAAPWIMGEYYIWHCMPHPICCQAPKQGDGNTWVWLVCSPLVGVRRKWVKGARNTAESTASLFAVCVCSWPLTLFCLCSTHSSWNCSRSGLTSGGRLRIFWRWA